MLYNLFNHNTNILVYKFRTDVIATRGLLTQVIHLANPYFKYLPRYLINRKVVTTIPYMHAKSCNFKLMKMWATTKLYIRFSHESVVYYKLHPYAEIFHQHLTDIRVWKVNKVAHKAHTLITLHFIYTMRSQSK